MHLPRRALALLALLSASGCVKLDSYNCAQSSECQSGDLLGTCELGGMCSFPDPACPSGKKYGELAGEQSGQCVGMVEDTTGAPTTSPTEPATTDATSTTFDPGTSTTFDPTTTSSSEVTATTTSGTTTSTSTSTGEPDTTGGGPTCGAIGDKCVAGACCGGCAVCDADNICQPAPADDDPCGTCSFCGGDGECAFAGPDTPCPANCADIVWKEEVAAPLTACYAYGDMPTQGTCDGEGGCTLPDPVLAMCPEPEPGKATKLAECEVACQESKNPCIPGGPASAVDMDSFCSIMNPTPACDTTCSDDKTFLNPATCVMGACVHSGAVECGPYVCDSVTLMCLDACATDVDCIAPAICDKGMCL